MINPGEIPQIPGDMEALAGHASAITKVGGDFAGTGRQVNAAWQSLASFYRAPEVAQLLAATGPVQSVSAAAGEDIAAVGAALTAYAAEVAEIKRQLAALQAQAGSFVSSVAADDAWREDEGKVEQHNGLVQAVNTQVAAFLEAQRRCANTINALYGGRQYRAENGDGQVQDGEYGFTADVLNAAAGENDILPWGAAEEHDRGFFGDVGGYFDGVGTSFNTMVGDLGSLIGRDPATGGWSWSNAGQAWTGVGTFGYSLVIYSNPITIMIDQTAGMPGLDRRDAGNLLLGAGKGLIAYDTWGEDNARAAGMATFNIVSAVVGTKGASAGLRGAGTAATTIRGSATAAHISSAFIRAGNWIDNLPTTGQIATTISSKLNLHIPKFQFGPIPAFADGLPPPGGHRFDVEMPPSRRPDPVNMDAGNGSGADEQGGYGPEAKGSGNTEPAGSRSPHERASDDREDPAPGMQDSEDGREIPDTLESPGGHHDSVGGSRSEDGVGGPSVDRPSASNGLDPFDQLDEATRQRLIDEVISDSNKKFPMTHVNAEAVLRGGPPGTTPAVAGPSGEGGDVRFVDSDGKTVLARENKSIGGGFNSFNQHLKHAASQQLRGLDAEKGVGEVWVQVRPGTDVEGWIRRFQGSRPVEKLADYDLVDVIFRDPNGNELGRYNLGTRLDRR